MMHNILLSLSAVVATWCVIMGFLYVFKEWVYQGFPVMWNRISLWLTVLSLVVAVCFLVVQLVAGTWLKNLFFVMLPRAICLVALHMFMVVFRSYMTVRYHQSISQFKFFAVLGMVYSFFVIGTWATFSYAHPAFMQMADMMVYLLLQGAVIGTALVSFLLSRIPKQMPASHHTVYQDSRHDSSLHQPFNSDNDQW